MKDYKHIGIIVGRKGFIGSSGVEHFSKIPPMIFDNLDAMNIGAYLGQYSVVDVIDEENFGMTNVLFVNTRNQPYNGEVKKLDEKLSGYSTKPAHPILFVPTTEGMEEIIEKHAIPIVISGKTSDTPIYEIGRTKVFCPRIKDVPHFIGLKVEGGTLQEAYSAKKTGVVYPCIRLDIPLIRQ